MMDFIFGTLWGWVGTAVLVVLACIAVGYFFPPFRRIAIEIAAVVIAAASIYTKGNRDEAKKWNKAIDRDVAKGKQARSDAERDVSSGRVRGDEWDRDKNSL